MTYSKPELTPLAKAVAVIQFGISKTDQYQDADPLNPVTATVNAYEADE